MSVALCIVVPVLNEAASLGPQLAALAPLRQRGVRVVVADGGSEDNTRDIAARRADFVIEAPRGRGAQMNAGAATCAAHIYLFLHADTRLPADADRLVVKAVMGGALWGRFDVHLDSPRASLCMVAWAMNLRSRLSSIATGDQAMFVRADVFRRIGGFADIALMEDIDLSSRLRQVGLPDCLRQRVTTSARRWEQHGVWRTMVLMWRLRAAYFFGTDPAKLAKEYGYRPRNP